MHNPHSMLRKMHVLPKTLFYLVLKYECNKEMHVYYNLFNGIPNSYCTIIVDIQDQTYEVMNHQILTCMQVDLHYCLCLNYFNANDLLA